MPTGNFGDYEQLGVYESFLNDSTVLLDDGDNSTFGVASFIYKGRAVEGTRAAVNNLFERLRIPVDYLFYSKMEISTGYSDLTQTPVGGTGGTLESVSASCSDESSLESIVDAISVGLTTTTSYQTTIECQESSWKVFSCATVVNLCVDCVVNTEEPCATDICPDSNRHLLNNPFSDAAESCPYSASASYSVLKWTVGSKTLYPEFNRGLTVAATTSILTVSANISSAGTLYCAALTSGVGLQSVYEVTSQGFSGAVESGNEIVTVNITQLAPESAYDVYCYTEDYEQHYMPLSGVSATLVTVSTLCCRSLEFIDAATEIAEYDASSSTTEFEYSFQIDALPSSELSVSVVVAAVTCDSTVPALSGTTSSSVPSVFPANFTYDSSSQELANSFIVRGAPGCYSLEVQQTDGGDTYNSASISPFVYIRSTAEVPDPPVLVGAVMSNDGLKVTVSLNSDSDRGASIGLVNRLSMWTCASLLSFSGSSGAQCVWVSKRKLEISQGTPVHSGTLTLLALKLQPACPTGYNCGADSRYTTNADASSVIINAPTNPLSPIPSIATPDAVGGCDSIVLDATLSSNSGGRAWAAAVWTATGNPDDPLAPFDTDAIEATLYTQGSNGVKTSDLLIIPNTMLVAGTLTVTLKLTNFLNGVALLSKTILVSSNTVNPTISIVGSSSQSVYRVDPLTVVARAKVPTCGGEVSSKVVDYVWKVYHSGVTYDSSLTSSALDVRSFVLPGYRLESNTDYVLSVTASLAENPTATSSASITVRVLSSGVQAVFVGGTSRTVSVAESFAIDASASYDVDYPSRVLTYSWICTEKAPTFGAACDLTLPTTSSISFAAFGASSGLTLSPAKSYSFTVYVSNSVEQSNSATSVITTTSAAVPAVTMAAVANKYNAERKIVLSAQIVGVTAVNGTWTSEDDLDLTTVARSTTNKILQAGTVTFELALGAYSFTAGVSYTFGLTAFYPTSTGASPEATTVTILLNAAPTGGSLVATPSTGVAMNTTYFFQTKDWVDDPDDYPLVFVMSYYAAAASEQIVIKNVGTQSYAEDVLMGQGLAANDYNVTCFVSAADVFGGTANATTAVQVEPVTDVSALAAVAVSEVADAFESGDSAAVSQVVGAISAAANAVVCDSAPDCAALNRSVCANTANTCSECLAGYLGDTGDANTQCSDPLTLTANGKVCVSNSTCQSNFCASGICSAKPKSCDLGSNSLACNGNSQGICQFVRNTGEQLVDCREDDSSCRARCVCVSGFGGATCGLTTTELESQRDMRETLCASVYGLLSIQDISADVVSSRASSVGAVLKHIEEISDSALENCTLALTETVIAAVALDPDYVAGNDDVLQTISDAFSAVLAKGSELPAALLVDVEDAVDAVAAAVQALMAVGEDPVCTPSNNINSCLAKAYADDALETTYTPARSAADDFNDVAVTEITLQSGDRRRLTAAASSVVQVAVVQQTSNPHGVETNSTSVRLTVSSTPDEGLTTIIVLRNVEPMEYTAAGVVNETVSCSGAEETLSVSCADGSVHSFECSAGVSGEHEYGCPGSSVVPQCIFWDSAAEAFAANPNCEVVAYTSMNTTCACTAAARRYLFSTPPAGHRHSRAVSYHDLRHRVLPQQQFALATETFSGSGSTAVTFQQLGRSRKLGTLDAEIASQATIVGSDFVTRFSSVTSLSLTDVKRNIVVFAICLSLLCTTIVGLGYFVVVDVHESKRAAVDKDIEKKALKPLRNVFDFFNILLPDELSAEPMWQRLWRKILVEHDYFCMLMPYNKDRSLRSLKFVQGMSLILNFMFIDTLLAGLFFDDGGSCGAYSSEKACLLPNSLDQVTSLCSWDSDSSVCSFQGPSESFLSTLILTM